VIADYLYFALKNEEEYIKTLPEGTVQKNMNRDVLRGVELQVPPLTEQQTLQSDFDEIRHKHAKIAVYKAKEQEAIQRLIPGANTDLEDAVKAVAEPAEVVPENTIVVPENTVVTENSPTIPLEPTKTKRTIKLKKGSIV
jgi:hypothetical protein